MNKWIMVFTGIWLLIGFQTYTAGKKAVETSLENRETQLEKVFEMIKEK